MNIEMFVHSDQAGPRATVSAWWLSSRGVEHSVLLHRVPLDGVEPGEQDPWGLLAGLYRALAAARR